MAEDSEHNSKLVTDLRETSAFMDQHPFEHNNCPELLWSAADQIEYLQKTLDDLYSGRTCVLPKTLKHAENMHVVAEASLKQYRGEQP